jgi:hypothetical protein
MAPDLLSLVVAKKANLYLLQQRQRRKRECAIVYCDSIYDS